VIGRKNFFMLCIVIFTISSFLCGIAATLTFLLLFRAFQGVGEIFHTFQTGRTLTVTDRTDNILS
jgi:MFS family permease